jgi:pyruvate/2-oxoglutarate dehydrogenase complex dihydrolipoamide acyltransferase (E2) component
MGFHNTSDNPKEYRSDEEVLAARQLDPIARLRRYVVRAGLLSEEQVASLAAAQEIVVREVQQKVDDLPRPDPVSIFSYAYASLPPRLEQQRREFSDGTPALTGVSAEENAPRKRGDDPPPRASVRGDVAPASTGVSTSNCDDESIPLSPLRRRIAERMAMSKSTIPHALQVQEVDMAGVVANIAVHREAWKQRNDSSLTPLPYVLAAAAGALRRCPQLNSTYADNRILVHRQINIGVAVALPDGVVAPVVRSVDSLSISEIARSVGHLVAAARRRSLAIGQMKGGTFTVNNSGALGTLFSYSVIQPGESGILTMGAIKERPCVVEGTVVIRPLMYLSLSVDHRVVDGSGAATFLGECRRWLESVTSATSLD